MHLDRHVVPPPGVIVWYRLYCVGMVVLYVLCILFGVYLFFKPDDDEDSFLGIFLAVGCIPLALVYAVALFLPRQRWVWIFHLVLICGGLTSVCCLPVCIPLLIHWIKPATKAYFGY